MTIHMKFIWISNDNDVNTPIAHDIHMYFIFTDKHSFCFLVDCPAGGSAPSQTPHSRSASGLRKSI